MATTASFAAVFENYLEQRRVNFRNVAFDFFLKQFNSYRSKLQLNKLKVVKSLRPLLLVSKTRYELKISFTIRSQLRVRCSRLRYAAENTSLTSIQFAPEKVFQHSTVVHAVMECNVNLLFHNNLIKEICALYIINWFLLLNQLDFVCIMVQISLQRIQMGFRCTWTCFDQRAAILSIRARVKRWTYDPI